MPHALRLLILAALAVLLAGCGAGGGAGADGDPASLVPADAGVYFEAQVRPEGDRRRDVMAAAGKLLRTPDPERRLRELFEQATRGADDVDYDRDLKPWLGRRAAVVATDLAADEPRGLVIAATTDEDKARDAIDAAIRRSPSRSRMQERSYEGVDYRVARDRTAVGIVDGFVVAGDEAQLKRAVRAVDGDSLADSDRYQDTLDGLDRARLGTGYLDVRAIFAAARRADPAAAGQLAPVVDRLGLDRVAPVGLAFLADGERLAIEGVQSLKGAGRLYRRLAGLSSGRSTPLTGELPADAWGAYGVPELGATAEGLYDELAGGLGGAAISGQLRQALGIDLQEDVFSWIGDTAVFVRGASEASLEGALVIEATDPARARRSVAKLVGVATRQSPDLGVRPARVEGAELAFAAQAGTSGREAYVAVGGRRVVVGVGRAAVRDALAGAGETLGMTEGFERAKRALGGLEPSFYLAMPAVLALADASGSSAGDPGYRAARPYLATVAALAAGAERDGDRLVTRFSAAFSE